MPSVTSILHRSGLSFGFLLSLALHALLGLGSLLVALPAMLRPGPISVEILPPRRPAPPPQEVLPPPSPTPPAPASPGPGGVRRQRPRPPRPAPPPPPVELVPALQAISPDGSSLTVILRMTPLRASPFRPNLEALLAAFPDARLLSLGAHLQARALATILVDALDALIISTPDPRNLTATTLVGLATASGLKVPPLPDHPAGPWDPRLIQRPTPQTLALAPPHVLSYWHEHPTALANLNAALTPPPAAAGPAAPAGPAKGMPPGRGAPKAPPATPPTAASPPAVTATLHGFVVDLRALGADTNHPIPLEQATLNLSADPQPLAELLLIPAHREDAAALLAVWPRLREEIQRRFGWIVGGLLAELQARSDGREVAISGRLPPADLLRLLDSAALVLSLAGPAPPPLAPADAGIPPASTPDAAEAPSIDSAAVQDLAADRPASGEH